MVGGATLHATPYWRDSVNAPEAMFDFEADYDEVMGRGADRYRFTVTVFAQRTDTEAGQIFLDALRDPDSSVSVKQVLEGYEWAGELQYLNVERASRIQATKVGEADYLTVDFEGTLVV